MAQLGHWSVFLATVAFAVLVAGQKKTFRGDVVIQVIPENAAHLKLLQDLEISEDIDFWVRPTRVGHPVDVHITGERLEYLSRTLANQGMSYTTKITDLQKLIDNEARPRSLLSASSLSESVLTKYVSAENMTAWLSQTVRLCQSPLVCSLMPFGESVEGREMVILKISSTSGLSSKKAIFVDGGIHAREWISPVFVNNIINKLIHDYSSDSDVTEMLDTYDWYIIPLLNPDGYEFSRNSDRMWRKNRAPTTKRRCIGVDLNRNFGYMWGVSGVSSNPCSEVYPGENAFSEPESQALKDFLSQFGADKLKAYLSFHAYGQYFLYPWGYDAVRAPNDQDLEAAGVVGKETIEGLNTEGEGEWLVGNSAILLYPAAGASDDWAYASAGAEYSYTVELPPNDSSGYGFVLPESHIPRVTSTVWPGIKALMKKIMHPRNDRDQMDEKVLLEKLMEMLKHRQ